MALCKNIETRYGVTASYHKITQIQISWHTKECTVYLSGYIDKSAREQDKSPIYSVGYDYFADMFDFNVEGNLTEQLYSKIKLEKEFTNATDC